MNFPFYIARRYLFSKKSTNAINVISGISVVGVAVASLALVVTLSVFNGFHDMVASFFTQLDPQLKITPAKGKTAASNDSTLMRIRQLDEVAVATDVLEDQALAVYGDRQQMVTIKGVDDNYDKLTHIRQILEGDGDYALHAADMNYGILGLGVAYQLGIGYTYREPLKIYAPRREGQINMANLQDGFVEDELYSPGVLFSIKQGKYDKRYIITAIQFTRNLFDRDGELTSLELRLKPGSNFEHVKAKVQEMAGTRFVVRDRYEQQEDLPHHESREAHGIYLPHLYPRHSLFQHHRQPLYADDRQAQRRGDPTKSGCQRPPNHPYLPLRRSHDFRHWCRDRHCYRPVAMPVAAAVRLDRLRIYRRFVCGRCLSCQRPPVGYRRSVLHCPRCRLYQRVVSRTLFCQTATQLICSDKR